MEEVAKANSSMLLEVVEEVANANSSSRLLEMKRSRLKGVGGLNASRDERRREPEA